MQKREKRKWLFRKASDQAHQLSEVKVASANGSVSARNSALPADQRHAIAVATATAAAAEAAVATAKAAVEIIRLTGQQSKTNSKTNSFRRHSAATIIQTAFRGYLVRISHFINFSLFCFFLIINGSKEDLLCVGKEGSCCAQGDCKASSFNQRTECAETSKDDFEMHAGSAPSSGSDSRSTCTAFP